MATREGIYVGGHEIVKRYVGSKLVWQKALFQEIGVIHIAAEIASGSVLVGIPVAYRGYVVSGFKNDEFWRFVSQETNQFLINVDGRKIIFEPYQINQVNITKYSRTFKMRFQSSADQEWIKTRWFGGGTNIEKDITIYKKKKV